MDIASGEASRAVGSRHLWPSRCLWALVPPHVLWLLFMTQSPVFSAQSLTGVSLSELFPPPPPSPKSLCPQVELSAKELLLVLFNYSRSSHPPNTFLIFVSSKETLLSSQLPPNSSTRGWRINPKGRAGSALRTCHSWTQCIPPKPDLSPLCLFSVCFLKDTQVASGLSGVQLPAAVWEIYMSPCPWHFCSC